MSTVTTSEIPYFRIFVILALSMICIMFLEREFLAGAVAILAMFAAVTVSDTEKAIRAARVKPPGVDYLRSHAYRYLDFFAGSEVEYRQFFAGDCTEPERIVHTAIMHKRTRRIYSVASPGRHHQVISMMRQVGLVDNTRNAGIDGFVSSKGRFLNRVEALIVARLANQLIRKTPGDNELFSEDLWDPQVLTAQQLHDKAQELIMNAHAAAMVVTIDLTPALPRLKFMGNYQMVADVRDSLPVVRQKLAEAQRLKAVKQSVVA